MLSRLSAVRRMPITFACPSRYYSTARNEGSVAQSPGFSGREKAQEDQYIRRNQEAQLKKLRADLETKKAELDALEESLKEDLKDKKE